MMCLSGWHITLWHLLFWISNELFWVSFVYYDYYVCVCVHCVGRVPFAHRECSVSIAIMNVLLYYLCYMFHFTLFGSARKGLWKFSYGYLNIRFSDVGRVFHFSYGVLAITVRKLLWALVSTICFCFLYVVMLASWTMKFSSHLVCRCFWTGWWNKYIYSIDIENQSKKSGKSTWYILVWCMTW